jgi:hypothetical protein
MYAPSIVSSDVQKNVTASEQILAHSALRMNFRTVLFVNMKTWYK